MIHRALPLLLAICATLAAAGAAAAQGYPVTAGEHVGFTRVVIHAPPGVRWRVEGDGTERRLTVTPAPSGFDLSRVFDRIRRERLAQVSENDGELTLTLACQCETNTWEERPGLIVTDIRDALPDPAETREPSPETPPAPVHDVQLRIPDVALNAGVELARRLSAQRRAEEGAEQAVDLPSSADLLADLALPVSQALSQGILEPATNPPQPPETLLQTTEPQANPTLDHIRASVVTDRPTPDTRAEPEPDENCAEAPALAFLLSDWSEPFGTAFGRLSQTLYGEFDQPDPESAFELIRLYLAHGFGAEARALIANAAEPVFGRDLLLGLSDILEGRNTNSRLRLAQLKNCRGTAGLLAHVADEAPETGAAIDTETASDLALTFSALPGPLRAILGPALAQRLMSAGALDEARIVIGAAQRSEWISPTDATFLEALLDRARGFTEEAEARLDPIAQTNATTLRARLDIALAAGTRVDPSLLEAAEAMANSERTSENGIALMSGVARLRLRDGDFDGARATIDRLTTWVADLNSAQSTLSALESDFWRQLALDAEDMAFLRQIFSREEWKSSPLPPPTRRAVADRLLNLGLARQALEIISTSPDASDSLLRARAHLQLGQPDEALANLDGLDSPESEALRAEALERGGQIDRAAQMLLSLNRLEPAASLAVRARDWQLLEDLPQDVAQADGVDRAQIARALARAPGALLPVFQVDTPSAPEPRAPAVPPPQNEPAQPSQTEPAQDAATSEQPAAEAPPVNDAPEAAAPDISRMGLIRRSRTLLEESSILREALSPLLTSPTLVSQESP